MRILIVGGAGHVASIIRPALEAEHDCWYFDRVPVRGRRSRTYLGDVANEAAARRAVKGKSAILYLALGLGRPAGRAARTKTPDQIEQAFKVNVAGFYNFCWHGLAAGVRRIVYASSMSVYAPDFNPHGPRTEADPTDGYYPYAISKRGGEFIAQATAQFDRRACVTSLRLFAPLTAEAYARHRTTIGDASKPDPITGPKDLARLFVAVLKLNKPGHHAIQATGDTTGKMYDHALAQRLLGWQPRGE